MTHPPLAEGEERSRNEDLSACYSLQRLWCWESQLCWVLKSAVHKLASILRKTFSKKLVPPGGTISGPVERPGEL